MLSILVQGVDALLLNAEKNREYVQSTCFDAHGCRIKHKYDLVRARRSSLDDGEKKKCASQCCRVALRVVPIACIAGVLPLMVSFHSSDDTRLALLAGVFMLVFIAAFLAVPPLSLAKAGLAIYLRDAHLAACCYMAMHTVRSRSPVVTPIFAFIVMFVTLQALSMVFLMLAFHRSRAGTAVDGSPLLRTVKLKDSENDGSQQNSVIKIFNQRTACFVIAEEMPAELKLKTINLYEIWN